MIERVARVLCLREGDDPDRICVGEGAAAGQSWPAWFAFHTEARDLIMAMREPTVDMTVVGGNRKHLGSGDMWRAMIDEALADPGDRTSWHS